MSPIIALDMRKPRLVFIDLDGTLISTRSGKSNPQGIWDMKFDFKVMAKLREIKPEYVFIVSNQCGIGLFVSEKDFDIKLDYVAASVRSYIKHSGLKAVESIYCATVDTEDPFRKPNTGMLEYMINLYKIDISKDDMIMVGDASGNPGQGDADILVAKNFGIKYLDVNDFAKTYFE